MSDQARDEDQTLDSDLLAVFETNNQRLDGGLFEERLQTALVRRHRWTLARRACFALGLALLLAPVQDVALDLSAVLLTRLVEIENRLAAELLAPINTVGGIVSLSLLGIRLAHRRLFGLAV